MANIFISYRRADSAGSAGRLYDHLLDHFEEHQIFKDVISIGAGENFKTVISNNIDDCDVFLTVVGENFLIPDVENNVRIDDPEDFVHWEIKMALLKNKRIIPVLVDNASMPLSIQLPVELKEFANKNAVEIRHSSFKRDVAELIAKRLLASNPQSSTSTRLDEGDKKIKFQWSRWKVGIAIAVSILVGYMVLLNVMRRDSEVGLPQAKVTDSPSNESILNKVEDKLTPKKLDFSEKAWLTSDKLMIKIRTNKGGNMVRFKKGEIMNLLYMVNRPCHLRLFYKLADGRIVLFNKDDMYITGSDVGSYVKIDEDFRATPPLGNETLYAFAQNKPFPKLNTREEGGYFFVEDELPEAIEQTRGFQKVKVEAETQLKIITY